METEEEVDILMSSDIYSATLSTKSISFTRAQTGWLFREDKTERVGNFLADFYLVNGLVLESRKRREHLSEEDILRNKAIMESLSKGGSLAEQNFEPVRRGPLPLLLRTLLRGKNTYLLKMERHHTWAENWCAKSARKHLKPL